VSYGQNKHYVWDRKIDKSVYNFINSYYNFVEKDIFDNNYGFSVGALMGTNQIGNGNITIEGRFRRGGVGIDIYTEPEMSYSPGRSGYGTYYITPSIHGFDLQLGFGLISETTSSLNYVGDRVNGYTKQNGTYVNSYLRNVHSVSNTDYNNTKLYSLIGITKDIHLYGLMELELKGMVHISNSQLIPTLGIGIKIGKF
jgi:hypothetical protein